MRLVRFHAAQWHIDSHKVGALGFSAGRYLVAESLVYYAALAKAHVPAEMHLYEHGGHAFGLRRTKFPITEWPRLAEA
jgi:acetyl esterase/lipase